MVINLLFGYMPSILAQENWVAQENWEGEKKKKEEIDINWQVKVEPHPYE